LHRFPVIELFEAVAEESWWVSIEEMLSCVKISPPILRYGQIDPSFANDHKVSSTSFALYQKYQQSFLNIWENIDTSGGCTESLQAAEPLSQRENVYINSARKHYGWPSQIWALLRFHRAI
jgi:hypothetical protein